MSANKSKINMHYDANLQAVKVRYFVKSAHV
jgi:hypothetical protein